MNHDLCVSFYLNEPIPKNIKPKFSSGSLVNACDSWIESCHDHIQWFFPLGEPSAYNPNAPILTRNDIIDFKYNNNLRKKIEKNVIRFLKFLSFEYNNKFANYSIFEPRAHWITKNNHNILRITRLLKFLTLIDMPELTINIFNALCKLSAKSRAIIGQESYYYWFDATYSRRISDVI